MEHEQRNEIAERILAARKSRGWSQRRLADEAGVAENTVIALEKGTRQPQEAKLRAVLSVLGMLEPIDGVLSLDGVPEDVRVFLRVAALRLKEMDEAERARVLADMYPRLIAGHS